MIKRLVFIVGVVFLGISCKDFSFSSFVKGSSIASAGGKELYYDDVKSIFTPGMSPEDSINLQNTYVDLWIKKQLKISIAEKKFSKHENDIERMVTDYRNSLLIYKLESEYVKQNMDTTVTAGEITEYYENNKQEFLLPSALIKAVVVKIPSGFRQEAKMRELARSGDSEKIHDMIDISIKNNLEYQEFTSWTDYTEVVGLIPRLSKNDNQGVQSQTGFYEVEDGSYRYFLIVTDILREGSLMPIDMPGSNIRTIILNKRKQDLLKAMEDSIYNDALAQKKITIK